jgi:hypothetical protein
MTENPLTEGQQKAPDGFKLSIRGGVVTLVTLSAYP